MKKLIFLLPLLFSLLGHAQLDSAATKFFNSHISQYTTDSLEQDQQRDAWWNAAGPIFIDSLSIPINTSYTFYIQMKMENQTTRETGGEDIKLDISNKNGVYAIDYNFITYPFHVMKSLTGTAFNIILPPKGAPYTQGTGLAGVPIYWHTNRTFQKLAL